MQFYKCWSCANNNEACRTRYVQACETIFDVIHLINSSITSNIKCKFELPEEIECIGYVKKEEE